MAVYYVATGVNFLRHYGIEGQIESQANIDRILRKYDIAGRIVGTISGSAVGIGLLSTGVGSGAAVGGAVGTTYSVTRAIMTKGMRRIEEYFSE